MLEFACSSFDSGLMRFAFSDGIILVFANTRCYYSEKGR